MSNSSQSLQPIRNQLFLTLFCTLIGFMIISLSCSFLFFWPEFREHDREQAILNSMRVLNSWRAESEDLKQKLADWAIWDDTYQFMEDRNETYISSNLVANTFTNMAISDIIYLRNDGSVLWDGKISADALRIERCDGDWPSTLKSLTPIPAEGTSGIISINGVRHLVAVLAVTNSTGEAPPRGMMVMSRQIDEAFLSSMRETLRISFALSPSLEGGIDLLSYNPDTVEQAFHSVGQWDTNTVSYTLSQLGVDGVTMITTTPRDASSKARKLFFWNGGAVLLSVIFLLWIIGLFLRNKIVEPLGELSETIEGWETKKNHILDLKANNTLEISRIATAIRSMHGQIMNIAIHDQLTKLPNRRLLEDRLRQSIERCKRYQGSFALICIDLDGFKPVNDNYGHQAGDMVLQAVADRLLACVRSADTVARVGGDEFVILLDPTSPEGVELGIICTRIIEAIELPIALGGGRCNISASLGVAVFPLDGERADLLQQRADQAMYEAKKKGKARYQFASQLLAA